MWNWGNFMKDWYFVKNHLIKIRISKSFCTYVTHIIVIIFRRFPFKFLCFLPLNQRALQKIISKSIRLYLIDFQLNTIHIPNFAFFAIKSPGVAQRSVSRENVF